MKTIMFTKKRLLYLALAVLPLIVVGALLLWFGNRDRPTFSQEVILERTQATTDTSTAAAPAPMTPPSFGRAVVEINPVTIQTIGVRTSPVTIEPLGRTVRTTGQFMMDEQGIHTVSLKIDGWVEKLYADYEGALVQQGQPLLELYSPKLVTTQEEYLLALKNVRRLSGGAAESDARHLLEAARRRLAYWDLTEDQIRRLEETGVPQRTLTFYAPASGEVMRKNVAQGQYITAGQALMDIADLAKIWLIVDVYEQDLSWVKEGTEARIELAAEPGQTYTGRVGFVYHMMNAEMRTARARIVLPGGRHGPFKPGMYATAYLTGQQKAPTPVVPEEAVVRTGQRELVIVSLGQGRFRPQQVRAGYASDGKVQILEGLQGGEVVVTSAQFLIDSEARLRGVVAAMLGRDEASEAQIRDGSDG